MTNETVVGIVEDVKDERILDGETPVPFSMVFPTEVKYQASTGEIESVYIKEASVSFSKPTDENGETGKGLLIQLVINDVSKDVVVHKYNSVYNSD